MIKQGCGVGPGDPVTANLQIIFGCSKELSIPPPPQVIQATLILQILENAMGDKIEGELDKSTSGVIYTEAYVRR